MALRTLLVGIDEAGYGPLLGPLVVSAVAFDVLASRAEACLWTTLEAAVTRRIAERERRVCIVDSKKLHSPKDGIGRLERTVLACLAAWRGAAPHLHGLLGQLSPDTLGKLDEYPWYRGVDCALPRGADAGGVRIAAAQLSQALEAADVRIGGIHSEVLLEGHFNRLVEATRNKATVLSGLTLKLIQRVAEESGGRALRIFVDKQGARDHYGPLLMKAFEGRRLKVVQEDHEESTYVLSGGGAAEWHIRFREKGESHYLPVALASCVSKYLREVLMGCLNAFWSAQLPAVRPTAGYYTDGQRFLRDIRPAVAALGIQRSLLVRTR